MIPAKFCQGPFPVARNVGELKAILAELPDTLAVEGSFEPAVSLVVYNHGEPDMHLQIQDLMEDDE